MEDGPHSAVADAEIWTVVVAAGSGTRFGAPKQLQPLAGKRLIDWSIQRFSSFGEVVVVGPVGVDPFKYFASGDSTLSTASSASATLAKVNRFVTGGANRSESVRAGLSAVGEKATHVLVHDAARPLVGVDVVQRVIEALRGGADGAIPVVPVVDSLRTIDGQCVDRSKVVAVQTPQGFRLDVLREAYISGGVATDDSALVSEIGGEVVHVEGEVGNLKITVPRDLEVAEAFLTLLADEDISKA